ncbi:substrate-binding and VWA domain-containing protein [Luedemannella helvata]|uniref:Substrate-binding and VWA domain-containing protein n=1 Tax=Luedemannella helvata TaxID=349315 RepID=A0ABP4X035_9ACTN
MTTVAVVGGFLTLVVLQRRGSSCEGELRLTVAAAPEITPAVDATAQSWVKDAKGPNNECVSVEVTAAEPVDVAAAIASAHRVTMREIGQADGATKVPDVWIPDSSTWLQRLQVAAATAKAGGRNATAPATADKPAATASAAPPADRPIVPEKFTSIGRSPVVLAVPEPLASTLGWPKTEVTWPKLLKTMNQGTPMRVGIVEPTRNAAGLSGLLAMSGAAQATGAKAQENTVAALRALVKGKSALTADLLAEYPKDKDAATLASKLGAAPLPEFAVVSYNATEPPVRLAAIYMQPSPLSLDYPYTVLPTMDPVKNPTAAQLLAALHGDTYAGELAKAGLRASDGKTGAGFAAPTGAPTTIDTGKPADPAAIVKALTTWTAVTAPSRMLAIIDVSGSMGQLVPTAGNATREQVTVEAAKGGLALFDDDWSVGLWTFSTFLDGNKDYQQLVPIAPISSQRNKLLAALNTITPKNGGATGLYDTMLAGYREVKKGWAPGRVNSMVILTDGQNEDSNSISLDGLLEQLRKEADPEKPIQVIAIGIGEDASRTELEKIVRVTGGGVFIAKDPAQIGDIFLQAIALRAAS